MYQEQQKVVMRYQTTYSVRWPISGAGLSRYNTFVSCLHDIDTVAQVDDTVFGIMFFAPTLFFGHLNTLKKLFQADDN